MNKNEILHNFKVRIESGKSIKYKVLKSEDPSLLYAIERKIGSIFKCAKLLGISEEELVNKYGMTRAVNRHTLDEDEIRNRLLYLKSIGKLTTLAMRTEFDDLRLEQSIKKLYGSVEDGLKRFGLKRDSRLVPIERLIYQIHNLYDNGEDLSYTNMIENHSKIIYTICNKMNMCWYSVLDELGIPYEAKRTLKYSKEDIEIKLKALVDKYGELNYSILKKYESGILNHVNIFYDSIFDFYIEYGFNPEDCMDMGSQKFKGFAFEKVFKEILDKLNITYKYNKFIADKTLRPDFQLNDDVFVDCKLSSWTSTIESTIEKYTPYCDKLIIVFLRGEEKHLDYLKTDKVEFIKVDYYLEKLDEVSRQYFTKKLNYILNNDEFIESVTTERLTS